MMLSLLFLMLGQRPVIELDDLNIEGEIRRPSIIDLEKPRLNEKIEKNAVLSLIQLEKKLLKPRDLEAFRKETKSAK